MKYKNEKTIKIVRKEFVYYRKFKALVITTRTAIFEKNGVRTSREQKTVIINENKKN
jgi:hypothetical protein